jgi:Flp pilus assembly pilin Flp
VPHPGAVLHKAAWVGRPRGRSRGRDWRGTSKRVYVVRMIAQHLWRDRRGAALIEYALLVGLVTLTVLGAVISTGSWAHGM